MVVLNPKMQQSELQCLYYVCKMNGWEFGIPLPRKGHIYMP